MSLSFLFDLKRFLMVKKFLVADQFRNKIAVQIKIPIQMEFYDYLRKPQKIISVMRSRFRSKFQFKWTFMNT